MGTLAEFEKITDAEEFFEFFDINYDERLVQVKRFHIMKKFGELVEKAKGHDMGSDAKLLEYYKFALLSVYKNFENGYSPSAAAVWSFHSQAWAARSSLKWRCRASGVPCSSTGIGVEPVVSTPMPTMLSGRKPRVRPAACTTAETEARNPSM